MDKMIAVAARLLLAQIFFIVGWYRHVYLFATTPGGYDQFQASLGQFGLPGIFAPLMILVEIVAATLLVLGWKTRAAALTLAIYSVFIALVFYHDFGNPLIFVTFLQYFAVAGGMLLVAAYGPGPCSLDNLNKK